MEKMKFIQFIGTQRSGSNLLRIMLNQLKEISAPHPPHILRTFIPLLPMYGDLDKQSNFEDLVQDVCTWVELNPVVWHKANFDRSEIIARCNKNSLIELFYQIYAYYAELDNCEFVCCKSMSNVNQYKDLESAGIDPYYIYLYRDGRDVACSFKKAIVGEKHVYDIAKQWKTNQERSFEVSQNIASNRFIAVNYRDLITHPKSILEKICTFLNVPYNHDMLDYFHAEESINTASSGEMWKNLSHPIMSENYNKFLKELSLEEIEIFEKLGFDLTTDYKNLPKITQAEIDSYNLPNKILKKQSLESANKHDIELRCPQKDLLESLTQQLNHKDYHRNIA